MQRGVLRQSDAARLPASPPPTNQACVPPPCQCFSLGVPVTLATPSLGAYRRLVAIVKRLRAPRCLRPSFWPPTLVLPPSSVYVCALSRIASLNKFPLERNWKSGLFLPSSQCSLRSQSGASTEVSCRMSKPEQQVWLPFRAHVGWFLRKFLCFVVVSALRCENSATVALEG